MAWTSPRTWVAAETVTAALMNTHVRDNLKALGDAWTSWSPSWTAVTTNPAIGNGTISGAYMQAGKLVHFWAEITMGSTTTFGSGGWQLNLPVSEAAHRWGFQGLLRDTSASSDFTFIGSRTGASLLSLRCDPTTAGNAIRNVTDTVPFTWASTDVLFLQGTYEAA